MKRDANTVVRPGHSRASESPAKPSRAGRFGLRSLVVLALATPLLASGPARGQDNPPCIEIHSEARYKNDGYDHIIRIDNHCPATAVCDVSTNVSPTPQRFMILAGGEVEVLTSRGSPSAEFHPHVECGLVLSK